MSTGIGVAGMIVNGILAYVGYQENQSQPPAALNAIALMLTLIPAVFHLAMGLLMFFYRINDDYYDRMKRGDIPGLKPVSGLLHVQEPLPGETGRSSSSV